MNEETRIYREYCWFALLLVSLAIGFIGHAPPGETTARSNAVDVPTAPTVSAPPMHSTP